MSERNARDAIVRAASLADADAYAHLFPELAPGDPAPTLEQIALLVPRMLMLDDNSAARGFVVAGTEGSVGFLRQLVVDPGARRRGYGARLYTAAADRVRAEGATHLRLNVNTDNTRAIAPYRKMGMRDSFFCSVLFVTHALRLRLPGSSTPLSLVTTKESDDGQLEAQFLLTPGQLAYFRAHSIAPCIVREIGTKTVRGLMRFVPSFPGAYPFCAQSLVSARALLGEIEHTAPTAKNVALVIERDEALAAALVAHGAVLRFRMLQMEAAL